ncbi:MAG TPA: hypothetical protein VIA62_05310 [Thermoanaerobaculia bacterium]|jgi:hypothetical protein|nr:hypothetical protein [Thermoanaerobaculia bacterium]
MEPDILGKALETNTIAKQSALGRRGFAHPRRIALGGLLLALATSTIPFVKDLPWKWAAVIPGLLYLGGLFCLVPEFLRRPQQLEPSVRAPFGIKGSDAFSEYEGELFQLLQRSDERDILLGWVEDTQVPLIVLTGDAGVGKTSLVRAGLLYTLNGMKYDPPIYWDARPKERDAPILQALSGGILSEVYDDILVPNRTKPRVIVVDHLECLPEEQLRSIFNSLESFVSASAPFRQTWMIIIRQEALDRWQHQFELKLESSLRNRIQRRTLEPFSEIQAKQIISELLRDFEIDRKVVDDVLREISPRGEVSPVSLAISIWSLWSLARAHGSDVNEQGYIDGGRFVGLIENYLADMVTNRVPPSDQRSIQTALAQLGTGNASVAELLASVQPADRESFEASLDTLASASVRVLNKISLDPIQYQLAEPLSRIRQALTPVGQLISSRCKVWLDNGRKSELLLSNHDLLMILPLLNEEARSRLTEMERRFIGESREAVTRRKMLWGTASVVALALFATSAIEFKHSRDVREIRLLLESWDLPIDLYEVQGQLEELSVGHYVTRLGWLREGLRKLGASGTRIENVEGLPNSLECLDISSSRVKTLSGLPRGLKRLDIRWSDSLESLAGVPKSLESLAMAGGSLGSLREIPSSVSTLTVGGPRIRDLAGLPEGLTSLTLVGTQVKTLAGIPTSVRSLSLQGNKELVLDRLPPFLTSFEVDETDLPGGLVLPKSLRDLRISRASVGLQVLPQELDILHLRNIHNRDLAWLSPLPGQLKELLLFDQRSLDPAILPESIRSLRIPWGVGLEFSALPKGLDTLDLSFWEVDSLGGLPGSLRVLDISNTPLTSLRGAPLSLRRVTLKNAEKITSLSEFPPNLDFIDLSGSRNLQLIEKLPPLRELNLSNTKVTDLQHFPASLKILDISGTPCKSLKGLRKGLEELTLSEGQIKTLAGLPTSVHRLHFMDRLP